MLLFCLFLFVYKSYLLRLMHNYSTQQICLERNRKGTQRTQLLLLWQLLQSRHIYLTKFVLKSGVEQYLQKTPLQHSQQMAHSRQIFLEQNEHWAKMTTVLLLLLCCCCRCCCWCCICCAKELARGVAFTQEVIRYVDG